MNTEILILTALTIITAATPLVYAAIGELVVEKSGVLNLGVEGMMLGGAVSSFALLHLTGNVYLGIFGGAAAGVLLASIFALLTLGLQASQVASGLALTIFGTGLTALLGQPLVGVAYSGLQKLHIPLLSELPLLGRLFFQHDILVYGSFLIVPLVGWFLYRTSAGLTLRAVGDSHDAAHALGINVLRWRFVATLFGGACAGVAGGYLSLAYTPMWIENMSAGRGWIALALVVFATWRPGRLLFGAYLFGAISILQLHVQAMGGLEMFGAKFEIPSQFMSMLPYLATIIVLVVISRDQGKIRKHAPQSIGKSFYPAN